MNLTKYKDIVFNGSTFPDDPYRIIPVNIGATVKNEYIPVLEKEPVSKGMKLLLTAMTHQEGFTKKSRSYRTNNPGNIGNTDSGSNIPLSTLQDGIRLQIGHMNRIAVGKSKIYSIGKDIYIPPFYSKEIANNINTYGIPPYLPGYRFKYTGQLDQFIKLYSTGARVTNSYINTIVSYFKMNGLDIRPESTLAEIISL